MEKHQLIEDVLDTTDEEVDTITPPQPHVDLEDTHPSVTRTKGKKTFPGADRNSDGKSLHMRFCFIITLIIFVLVLAIFAVSFTVGLFVGRNIEKGRNSCQTTTTTMPVPTPTPSPSVVTHYNWGDKVEMNGRQVDVLSWLDENMSANNMKNNLA